MAKVYVLWAICGIDGEDDYRDILGVFASIDGIKEKILEDFDRFMNQRVDALKTFNEPEDDIKRWEEARAKILNADISETITNHETLDCSGSIFPWDYYGWEIEEHEVMGGDK